MNEHCTFPAGACPLATNAAKALPLMHVAFRTTVSDGDLRMYEMRFRFPTILAMQEADRQWRAFAAGAPEPCRPGSACKLGTCLAGECRWPKCGCAPKERCRAAARSLPSPAAPEAAQFTPNAAGYCTRCRREWWEHVGYKCKPEAAATPTLKEAAAAKLGPWRLAVDTAMVDAGLDCTTDDSDPEACVRQLIEWTRTVALDPDVSAEAQALIDRGTLKEAAAPAGWLPIESAPKDAGMLLLGIADDDGDVPAVVSCGWWVEPDDDGPDNMGHDGGWFDVNGEFTLPRSIGAEAYRSKGFQPTHWMPLPAPPVSPSTAPATQEKQ